MSRLLYALLTIIVFVSTQRSVFAQTYSMQDYTAVPPFINQTVPPLVMLLMSKDHRLFIKAYNDIMDIDGNGTIETTYSDTTDYYGYFDPKKCYDYVVSNSRFEPFSVATGTNGHWCNTVTKWSGNFLNWAAMARIDVIRKTLYGGHRILDESGSSTSKTVLRRTWIPQDAHSWAKAYDGTVAGAVAINKLTPYNFASGKITLCNTNTVDFSTSGNTGAGRILVANDYYPYAASTENKQCVLTQNSSGSYPVTATLVAEVLVCVPGMLETNCDEYKSGSTSWYKPTGLMQRMGLNRQGTPADSTDDRVLMKFALISGSYGDHVGGGVLRSNTVDMNNEIDKDTGVVKSSSKIVSTINQFRILQYNYGTGWYDGTGSSDNCHQGEPYTLSNNSLCTSWGNPIGEMFYEAIRYTKGLTSPTAEFKASTPDPGLTSLNVESSWNDPYDMSSSGGKCPYCTKPFVLMISDAFPSFDSDHLPGSYWPSSISTSDTPSVQTLLDSSHANINALEAISNVFIGQNSSTNDRACSVKSGDFSRMRGLCVEEPTKQGSYYLAGLSHYAKTTDLRSDKSGNQNITTYSVVTNTPFPTLEFSVTGKKVQLVPIFYDGCPKADTVAYPGCTAAGTFGDNSKGELVDFKFCDTNDEASNGFEKCYDIMWDDAEYGWDYELDVRYRIYVDTDPENSPLISPARPSGPGSIRIRTKGMYAAAGHLDFAGYLINGVTSAGEYYEIRCGGDAGFNDCDRSNLRDFDATTDMSNSVVTRDFAVTGTLSGALKDPLWYAAKYGGFEEKDNNSTPPTPNLTAEWDKDGNGVPDTYFYSASPLLLEAKLSAAFAAILNRASSGTAASVLASSTTGEGALYQSFFFPTQFEGEREIKWTGYTQGLFVDALGNLREDTDGNGKLTYLEDKIIVTKFDTATNTVQVQRWDDSDGDGKANTLLNTVGLTEIKAIWEAGKKLAQTPASARTLYTWVDLNGDKKVTATEFLLFDTTTPGNLTKITPYLRADAVTPYTASNIVEFVRGCDPTASGSTCPGLATLRDKKLTVGGTLQVWKLGDPVYATPVIVGAPKERYDLLYGDAGYASFYQKYRSRRQVAYVGANDGMLHAFNVGFYQRGNGSHHGCFTMNLSDNCATQTSVDLGKELWGFIPQEVLPQLRWLADPAYSHVYYVDLKPKVTDARIFDPSDPKYPGGWGTILIGGMRMGGSCGNCPTTGTSNGKPMTFSADFGKGVVETRQFYSAYFVLDITDPESPPKLLWAFSDANLGFTTSYPAVVRMRPSGGSKTQSSDEKWFALFGSGPTSYDAMVNQTAKLYAVDLKDGPASTVTPLSTLDASGGSTPPNSFMGDLITVDRDLDFRVDVAYVGKAISGSAWKGKLLRLTTACSSSCQMNSSLWGIPWGSVNGPSEILYTFQNSLGVTQTLGAMPTAPGVTVDDSNNLWVFAGTGRYYSDTDKADTTTKQYIVGLKDPIMQNGGCSSGESSSTCNVSGTDLVDVSAASICITGIATCGTTTTQVTGVSGATTFTGLINLVKSKKGWFSALQVTSGVPVERVVASPVILGGIVFFPTFTPNVDICVASGSSSLYALYYVTGSAYSSPIVGTSGTGNMNINNKVDLGQGMATTVALHIGAQGNGTTGGGSSSGIVGCSQSSTGSLNCQNVNTALGVTSRYISWNNQRL